MPCRSSNARAPSLAAGRSGLLVGGVILRFIVLVEARPDHPGDGRCAELWNAPANQANRSMVRGRAFPLATVRGVGPNKAGQPGCCGAVAGARGWTLDAGSAPSSPRPRWSGTAACQAFGTGPIARPAMWMTPPTRRFSRMGALCFGDLGLLYGCSGAPTAPCRALVRGLANEAKWSSRTGLTLRSSWRPSPPGPSQLGPRRPCPPRARSIGRSRSPTDNSGRSHPGPDLPIGLAPGRDDGTGRAFQARDQLGPLWGHIRATSDRTTVDNNGHCRPVIRPAHRPRTLGTGRRSTAVWSER